MRQWGEATVLESRSIHYIRKKRLNPSKDSVDGCIIWNSLYFLHFLKEMLCKTHIMWFLTGPRSTFLIFYTFYFIEMCELWWPLWLNKKSKWSWTESDKITLIWSVLKAEDHRYEPWVRNTRGLILQVNLWAKKTKQGKPLKTELRIPLRDCVWLYLVHKMSFCLSTLCTPRGAREQEKEAAIFSTSALHLHFHISVLLFELATVTGKPFS